jgi:hypothetical protein
MCQFRTFLSPTKSTCNVGRVVPLVSMSKTNSLQDRRLKAEKGEAHSNASSEENSQGSEQRFWEI